MKTPFFFFGKMRIILLFLSFLISFQLLAENYDSKINSEIPLPEPPSFVKLNPIAYDKVKLSWRDNSDNEDGFEIQSTLDGVNYRTITTVPPNTSYYIDEKVNPNTPYIYRICAILSGQKTAYSNSNSAITPTHADTPVPGDGKIPIKPRNFKLNVCSFNLMELFWTAVTDVSGYKLERYKNGVLDSIFTLQADETKFYSYALSPETNYEYRLYALNVDKKSEPAVQSGTTPKREWVEEWKGLRLWINNNVPVDLAKVKEYSDRVAFYMLPGENPDEISNVIYEAYSENWEYVADTYGDALSDPRLYVVLLPTDEGGGVASIYAYSDPAGSYRNVVYVKTHRSNFKTTTKSGFAYDVMSHEIGHIVEGVGGGYSESMFYPVWGDSKWAEIFQYDIFKGVGSPRAQTWHTTYMNATQGDNYPNPDRENYWYRDFLYPVYANHGETAVLTNFWKLMKEHYKHKDGYFVGNSNNPGGRGNLGEMIHFFSGAAGVDVKSYAMNAFGWNDQYEMWLLKAKADYPEIKYADLEVPQESKVRKNICRNGGVITSNKTSLNDVNSLIDGNYSSVYTVDKGDSNVPLTIVYSSAVPALLYNYQIALFDKTVIPASWILYGSNDKKNWTVLDEQDSPSFNNSGRSFISISQNENIYIYYKLEIKFSEGSPIKFSEIELGSIEYPTAPCDLRMTKLTDSSVYLDWIGALNDGLEYYDVERSTNGINFDKIAEVSKYEISYIGNNTGSGNTFYYRITGKNKNLQEDVSSNVVSVYLEGTSLDYIKLLELNFYNVVNNLQNYPDNSIKVYSLEGRLVFNGYYGRNDLLSQLQSELSTGIYIVLIDTGESNIVPVRNKIFIN